MPSKRYKKNAKLVEDLKSVPLKEAVALLAKFEKAKFNETVDLALRLGVDPKQSDQMVRGTVPLPHGSGKNVRVLVFAKPGASAEAARQAGAEFVGFDDMIKKCSDGWVDFDVAVATPEAMVEVRKLGKVLGPRGLMPNPKTGTVTDDTAKAVKEVKAGPRRVQGGQDWKCSRPRRQARVSARADRGERPRCHRGRRQGTPRQREGHLPPELHSLWHHESRRPRGHPRVRRHHLISTD